MNIDIKELKKIEFLEQLGILLHKYDATIECETDVFEQGDDGTQVYTELQIVSGCSVLIAKHDSINYQTVKAYAKSMKEDL